MRTPLSRCAPAAALALAALIAAPTADAAPPPNTPTFFADHVDFTLYMQQNAKVLKGIEDFEYANMPPGGQSKVPFPDNLTGGVPHGPVFPGGLMSPNLTIRTNRNPGPNAAPDVPSNDPQALYALGPGAFGSNSIKVGEDLGILAGIHCSIDLIFSSGDKTGVGLDLSRFGSLGTSGWTIGVFDTSNTLLGSFVIAGPVVSEPGKTFFGVYSSIPIGRINIYDPDPMSPDGVDNIEMWVPAPGAASMLVLGTLALTRRRRR